MGANTVLPLEEAPPESASGIVLGSYRAEVAELVKAMLASSTAVVFCAKVVAVFARFGNACMNEIEGPDGLVGS